MNITEGNDGMIRQWSCDVCKTAVFDDYDDARHHEALCWLRNEEQLRIAKNTEDIPKEVSLRKTSKVEVLRDRHHLTTKAPVESRDQEEPPRDQKRRSSKKEKKDRWICDVCKVAKFVSYVDAYVHEKACTGIQINTEEKEQRHRGRIQDKNKPKSKVTPCKQQQPKQELQSATKWATTTGEVKWLCGVCEAVCYDDYEKACRHEKLCEKRKGDRVPLSKLPVLPPDYGKKRGYAMNE